MAKLTSMTVDALLKLRDEIGVVLSKRAQDLKSQLARFGAPQEGGGRRKGRRLGKVAPKYRGPNGETWAGRGAQPRWLTAEIKKGRKRDNFLIDKGAKRKAKKHSARRKKKAA
jgi:DNA-binding protein H-NS